MATSFAPLLSTPALPPICTPAVHRSCLVPGAMPAKHYVLINIMYLPPIHFYSMYCRGSCRPYRMLVQSSCPHAAASTTVMMRCPLQPLSLGSLLSAGGRQVVLYGGEGHEMIDGAGGQPPNVYTFDIASLTWHKNSTTCTTPDGSPGVRSLHIATVSTCTLFCLKQRNLLGLNHGPRPYEGNKFSRFPSCRVTEVCSQNVS